MNKCLLSVFAVVLLALTASASTSSDEQVKLSLMELLSHNGLPGGKTLSGFSFSNCGQPTDPSNLTQLSISPDPLFVGQNLTVTAKGFLSDNIKDGQGYNISLAISKNVFGVYIPVPCIDNLGSCTYDLCTLLGKAKSCPLTPWGVPCICPLAAGAYQVTAPGFTTTFPNVGISWLLNGGIRVAGTISDPTGKRLACIQVDLTISSK